MWCKHVVNEYSYYCGLSGVPKAACEYLDYLSCSIELFLLFVCILKWDKILNRVFV
jgi:hypothetical protein